MRTLEAIANTWIKRDTLQAEALPDDQKFLVKAGDKLQANWIRQTGTHLLAELGTPINGFYNWYLFKPHFKLSEQAESGIVETPGDSISEEGIALVKSFEGLHELLPDGKVKAYWDDLGGVWTIGWGTVNGVHRDMIITAEEADALKRRDLKRFEKAVNTMIDVPLNSKQFSALVSFAYNAGESSLFQSSLRRLLNAGDYRNAADRFLLWNKSGEPLRPVLGLARRRHAERALFLGEDWRQFTRPGWERLVRI
jgi:GH24 family phage-related lysozyme (muramidase)